MNDYEVHPHYTVGRTDHPALRLLKKAHADTVRTLNNHIELYEQQEKQLEQTRTLIKLAQDEATYWSRQIESLPNESQEDDD